jgi:hypothetical protein
LRLGERDARQEFVAVEGVRAGFEKGGQMAGGGFGVTERGLHVDPRQAVIGPRQGGFVLTEGVQLPDGFRGLLADPGPGGEEAVDGTPARLAIPRDRLGAGERSGQSGALRGAQLAQGEVKVAGEARLQTPEVVEPDEVGRRGGGSLPLNGIEGLGDVRPRGAGPPSLRRGGRQGGQREEDNSHT